MILRAAGCVVDSQLVFELTVDRQVANLNTVHAMEWTGREVFNAESLRDWFFEDNVAGRFKSAHGLTYATVKGAGHLVPSDKPAESLQMLQRWIAGEQL